MWTEEIEQVRHFIKQTKYLKKNPLRRWLISHYLKTISSLIGCTGVLEGEVLDVGCGEGFVAHYLSHHRYDVRLVGMDIDMGVLTVARQLNEPAHFIHGDVNRLPLRDHAYELVLCNEVLEHLNDPEQALQEVRRVAKRFCIVSVPREPHYRLANIMIGANFKRWGDDIDHRQRWTKRQFVCFLERHFRIVSIKQPVLWTIALCQVDTRK